MRFFFLILATVCAPASAEPALNQIQVIGSHNSYHIASPPELFAKIVESNPGAKSWNYTHPPLANQLDGGVRQFELDIFADSKGGLFASPQALELAGKNEAKAIPHQPDLLSKPGFKVFHIPDIDCWSNAPTLVLALRQMFEWSGRNPKHLPVMILVECKDQKEKTSPTVPETLNRSLLMDLEKEILSVIPADRILKPDDVRGGKPTLRESVIKQGWPGIESLRGKFIFALDNTDRTRDLYLEGNPSLEGRLLFVSAPSSGDPAAAWFKCNDPIREQEKIRDLVKAGFLVRTRADTNKPDPEMRTKAFDSGAQWISTDHFDTGAEYHAGFGKKRLVRINPMSGSGDPVEP
ncbi:phosphatidylinositol-specific phospholipase C1-like protein [Luteolibacter yonseiensis]